MWFCGFSNIKDALVWTMIRMTYFCLFLTSFRFWPCIRLLHFFVVLSNEVEFLVWHLCSLSRSTKPQLFRIFGVLQIILLIANTRNFGFVKSLTTVFGKPWLQTRKKTLQKSVSGVNAKMKKTYFSKLKASFFWISWLPAFKEI